MRILVYYICIYFVGKSFVNSEADPCENYEVITDETRAANLKLDIATTYPFTDDRLNTQWYRIINTVGENMPTEPPGVFMCNTWHPIWLNGTIPTTNMTVVTEQVCMQTFHGICEITWDISIMKCPGDYLVYKLLKCPVVDAGYCFGYADICAEGQSSETGMQPGCSDNYPHVELTPIVVSDLLEGKNSTFLEPVFKCIFAEMNDSLVYDIHWYINNNSVVAYENIARVGLLNTHMVPKDWITTYIMNMQVKCSVRARFGQDTTPSPPVESEDMIAGVILDLDLDSFVKVNEGEEVTIKLRSTVPVGCISRFLQSRCDHVMYINQISSDSNSNRCQNNVQNGDLAFKGKICGVTIPSTGWNDTLNMKVTGYIDNFYNEHKTRTANIHFTSLRNDMDPSGAWNRINIPDIKVQITDADHKLTGRACLAFTPSNFVTIYGDEYSFQGAGEYVLYRHKTLPYSVHILQTAFTPSSTGICGIAVRSLNSLFVLRTCNTIGQHYSNRNESTVPVIQYTKCSANDMTIRGTGTGYKINLHSGTEISFQYARYWIQNILIKPSVLDIDQVDGLCGNNVSDKTVLKSWLVLDPLQQMFIDRPRIETVIRPSQLYCTCKKDEGVTDISQFNSRHCNLTQPIDVDACQLENQLDKSIIVECRISRNKRSVFVNREKRSMTDDIEEVFPLIYDSSFDPNYIPKEPSWPEGLSENEAQLFCGNFIRTKKIVQLCEQYSSFKVEIFIQGCMTNIKLGGNTTYVEWMVGAIKDYCYVEISRNETIMSMTTENGEKLYDELLQEFCPPGCSNQKNCVNGRCKMCNSDEHIGHDCVAQMSEAPKDIIIPDRGACNTKQRPCLKTNIYGEFKSSTLYCKFNRFKITVNGKIQIDNITHAATYNNAHSISCEFPLKRRKRSTKDFAIGYVISLSYDRTHFGDNVTVLIYDGNCFSCDVSTWTCNAVNQCEEDMPSQTTEKSTKTRVAVTVFGAFCACLSIAVLAFWIRQKMKQKSNRKVSYFESTEKNGNSKQTNMIYYILPNKNGCDESESPPPYSSRRPSQSSEHSANEVRRFAEKKTPTNLFEIKGDLHENCS